MRLAVTGKIVTAPTRKRQKNAIKHSRKGVHQACLSLQSNPLMTSQSCSETKNLLPYIVKHLSRPAFTTKARRRAGLTERRLQYEMDSDRRGWIH
nr:MAG TPA: hypothetical protein [Caudoviricetes sp.]